MKVGGTFHLVSGEGLELEQANDDGEKAEKAGKRSQSQGGFHLRMTDSTVAFRERELLEDGCVLLTIYNALCR